MHSFTGEEKLLANLPKDLDERVEKLSERVYVLRNFGSSNATLILGDTSAILVDAFEWSGRGEDARAAIAAIIDKPVTTIIYTHLHPDHTGGAGAFADTAKTVIAHTSHAPVLGRQEKIAANAGLRGMRQFGAKLSQEEAISMGLSPIFPVKGSSAPLAVTEWIDDEQVERTIDGVRLTFIAAPGETDEQQAVWIADEKILCGGDNYYASWPNLCALRGSTYRDVDQWVASLAKYVALAPEMLVPGHGDVLHGSQTVAETIGNYHDAIEWVLDATLEGINKGQTPEELALSVKLPEKWASLPYLQEYYGTVAWSVRGIFAGYVGWFDGNPTHIGALPAAERAAKTIALAGGADKVADAIKEAIATEDMQWALELCDLLLATDERADEAKAWKAQALTYLGRMQTSANGRHYYLSCAKELG